LEYQSGVFGVDLDFNFYFSGTDASKALSRLFARKNSVLSSHQLDSNHFLDTSFGNVDFFHDVAYKTACMKKLFYTVLMILLPTFVRADSYVVAIEGMHCESCANSISKNLTKTFKKEKISDLNVDFSNKKATFEAKPIEQEKIKKTIESLGYTVTSIDVTPTASN
jgi:copper chaperone CopZ